MLNARFEYNLRKSKEQQSCSQLYAKVLMKFIPMTTSSMGMNREMSSLPVFSHLAYLYKLLKVVFVVPLEPLYKFRVLKKFSPMHRGENHESAIIVCFDSCAVQPPKMYWIYLPRVGLFCLGHLFMGQFYINTTGLRKNSEKESLNE